jgi:hypothetical protein
VCITSGCLIDSSTRIDTATEVNFYHQKANICILSGQMRDVKKCNTPTTRISCRSQASCTYAYIHAYLLRSTSVLPKHFQTLLVAARTLTQLPTQAPTVSPTTSPTTAPTSVSMHDGRLRAALSVQHLCPSQTRQTAIGSQRC